MDMDFSGQSALIGTPLVQVFSVTIKPDSQVCQVYGTIQIIDELGEVYLFDCDPNNAVTIHHHGTRSGTLPLLRADRPSFATDDFTITLDLKEKDGDAEFIRESFTWNGPNLFSYNKCCFSHDFRGKLGLATVYLSVLSVAMDTEFAIAINEPEAGVCNIYGKIVAYYGRNFDFLPSNHNFRLVLFDRTFDEAVELCDKGCIPLSTRFLSVPSYSSLVIEANLHYTRSTSDNSKGIINSKVESTTDSEYRLEESNDGAFRVTVLWGLANRIVRLPSLEMVSDENFDIDGVKLMEIFSARIFYDQRATAVEGVEVYGGIHVHCDKSDLPLFSSRKQNFKLILPDGKLALRGPSFSIKASHFDLFFNVKERDQKFGCNGYLSVEPFWKWPDFFTSAAISGENCYGVLHFAIFSYAVQAELEVTLSSCGNTNIHGSLIAYYKDFEYKSDYLKNYFRTRLLDVPENNSMELSDVLADKLESGDDTVGLKRRVIEGISEDTLMLEAEDESVKLKHEPTTNERKNIPLSRKMVAVPNNSSLTIEANLICSTKTNTSKKVTHCVNGSVNFHPQSSGTTFARLWEKDDIVIDVKVSWSGYPFLLYSGSKSGKLRTDTKRPSVEVSSEKKNMFN